MKMKKRDRISAILIFMLLFPLIGIASAGFIGYTTTVVAPNLIISDIYHSPENPTVGQPVNITAIIENIGGATARNVTVDFCIYSEPVIIRKEIGDIPPHSERSVSINYIFFSAGSHTIIVKGGADDAIIEEDVSNNNVSMSIIVLHPSPPIPPRGGGGGAYPHYFATPTTYPPRDTTPPKISNVRVTLGHSAVITWDTNEISDSLVKYRMKSRQYTLEEHNTTYILSHAIHLKELKENNTYYFVVNSTDPSGNAAETPEYIFILTPPSKEETIIKIVFPTLPHFIISWWIATVAIIAALIVFFLIYKMYKDITENK